MMGAAKLGNRDLRMSWTEKYRPQSVKDMVGNEEARTDFLEWLATWKTGTRPVLLAGPPGTGKTTLVKAVVRELGYDMVELNASDVRTKDRLESIIPPLLSNASVLGSRVLLFLDEVDGMTARGDRGGFATLISLLKEPNVPIVMAANAEVGEQIKELKKVSTMIRFRRIPPRLLLLYLDQILGKEDAELSIGDKLRLIILSGGDIRALINEAQSLASSGAASAHPVSFSVEMSKAVTRFFSADKAEEARDALARSEGSYADPRFPGYDAERRRTDKLAALFSSIVTGRVDDTEKLARMLLALSYADLLVGRMGRNRHWNMLRYIDSIVAYSLFSDSRGLAYSQYDIPFVLMNRVFREARLIRELTGQLAKQMHTSKRAVAAYYLPYLIMILAKTKAGIKEFLAANNIDPALEAVIEGEIGRLKK